MVRVDPILVRRKLWQNWWTRATIFLFCDLPVFNQTGNAVMEQIFQSGGNKRDFRVVLSLAA
jgi:hypothetical protein